jgi:hypothetical protein
MASFTAGTTFVDGVANDVTAAKLGALVTAATPTSGLIQDRTAETVVATNDTFLIGDASDSNTLKRMTVANVMKAEHTGTINTTAGTIQTLTSSTATITTGTVDTLNSTTATIPTLTSITKITSGTGTAASPAIIPTGDLNTGIFFPAADTIAFSEGGTEAMRIDSSGQVGIGVTSSSATLHVKSIGEVIRSETTDSTGNNYIGFQRSTGTRMGYVGYGSALSDGLYLANEANSPTIFSTNSLERVRIDSGGNVGIGETTPLALLHVAGGVFVKGAAAPAPAASATSSFSCGAASGEVQFASNGVNAGNYGSYNFYSRKGDSADSLSRMVINSSGNVGVGTASPAATLDVNGSFNATSGTIPTLVATTLLTTGTGTAAAPAIVPTGDTNTGFFFPAADTIAFSEGGAEVMRITAGGNVGIGTASPTEKLDVNGTINATSLTIGTGAAATPAIYSATDTNTGIFFPAADTIALAEGGAEAMRINSSGNVLIGKTTTAFTTAGVLLDKTSNEFIVSAASVMALNRLTSDGALISFYQDNTIEGTISVAGTTVSYNGGHLSRWSQLLNGQRDASIKKGTVMSNLNEMCEWLDKDGNLLPNEQLNRVKVSDTEGESNVAGVFVNWDDDDKDNPFDLNMAMTGDMIIRIAQGTIVNRGDLLMSAGNGTAKPQGDDISRSKTIAKVTSTHVTCTYEDGSYCVPCVLMAC